MTDSEKPLTEYDRGAMRAYLQRAEVRISTQHRIGTAYIGGAGLMLLIPIFLRDIVDGELTVLISLAGNLFPAWDNFPAAMGSVALVLTLGVPLVLSLFIPMYGLYLMLKDLVHFYFTVYSPGYDHEFLNPTLPLGGINFSPDDSPEVKRRVMKYQYVPEHMDYMMPFSPYMRKIYFDPVIKESDGEILPGTRNTAQLRADGVIPPHVDDQTVTHFNAAFGLARALDRQLTEEVAISEMHLVRNTLYLRRLMLRYVKTLLLFIWTTTISFIMLPMLRDERFPNTLILALGYVAWSVAVLPLMRLPARWIYLHRYNASEPHHVDAQLQYLENYVRKWCKLAVVFSLIALILAAISTAQTGL